METNESLKERYLKAWNVLDEGNEAEALRLFEEFLANSIFQSGFFFSFNAN